ncbi:MAG: 1-phosphofructokinase family hexose kinase [Anaerolineae bacterium]|nr:1-phosphofructokinase family hexose kinase [Anaerolineae bacterium]
MILTVTPNTTVDLTLFVNGFVKDRTMRTTSNVYSMGGKPTDASWILGEIGIPSLAIGFAAGSIGEKIKSMLTARGVQTDFIPVGGESRINTVIVDTADHTMSTITTSTLLIQPAHMDALLQRYERALKDASCVVTGGTLPRDVPPSIYTTYIALAKQHKVPVIFDAQGDNLAAGLLSQPDFVKPNRYELAGLVGYDINTLEDAYRAGCTLVERYHTTPIITLDSDGALAVLSDRAYYLPPIKVDVVSAAGAGDAMLAGLAASLDRHQPIEEGLRLGVAAATAVLLMPGTADCRRADVERFLPQVKILPYPLS